jgi:hypothetical protein
MDIILDNLDPALASEKLVKESVLFASLVSRYAEAEILFKSELLKFMNDNPELPANKVKIRAEGGKLYGEMRRLQAEVAGKKEIIQSLKKFVNVKSDEQRFSGNL